MSVGSFAIYMAKKKKLSNSIITYKTTVCHFVANFKIKSCFFTFKAYFCHHECKNHLNNSHKTEHN